MGCQFICCDHNSYRALQSLSAFPEERPSDDQERGSRVLCTDYKCSVLCLVAVWFLVFLKELLKEGCYRDTIAHFFSTPGQGTESPTNSSLMTGLSHYTGTRSAVDRHWEAFDSVWEGSHSQREDPCVRAGEGRGTREWCFHGVGISHFSVCLLV